MSLDACKKIQARVRAVSEEGVGKKWKPMGPEYKAHEKRFDTNFEHYENSCGHHKGFPNL